MIQSITITPVDKSMQKRAEALRLLNEFKARGFKSPEQFHSIVKQFYPEYAEYSNMVRLNNFWAVRCFNTELNNQLNGIIEKLKAE